MANTSSRTLRLLSLLQTRRYWPGEELAGQLRVSPRTLRRDIDRLRELGYPIQAQRGVAGGYQLAEAVRERIGRWASVSEIGATRCRVRMTADALEWPVLGLGMVGADFRVISPPELIDWVRDWGARFSRAAAGNEYRK